MKCQGCMEPVSHLTSHATTGGLLARNTLRYFNAAGCDPEGELGEDYNPETCLIPLVLDVALGRWDHIVIFGTDYLTPDGTCIRDYTYVSDLALEELKRRCQSATYNLGIGRGYSVREVIETCREVTGGEIRVIEGPRRPGDPPQLVTDSSKARKELGWESKVGFEKGLREVMEWYLENQEWVGSIITGEYQEYYRRVYEEGKLKCKV